MHLSFKIACLGIAATLVSFGATPVARVISAQPVNVDDIIGPARNFVPLAVGNEVTTDSASAVIQFTNGNTVTLQPHSKLRIEGQPSGPVGRVIKGSAIYDVARSSSNNPATGASNPVVRISPGTLLSNPAASRGGSYEAKGFLYRSPSARQAGVMAPQGMVFTGSFNPGGPAAEGAAAGPQILSPNGLTINLTATVNPTTGATTYVVSSIQQTITTPTGGTAVVTVTSGSLVGTTVGGISTTPGGTGSSFTFTPPGATTPLTPEQTSTAVQTGVQQAISSGVTSGTLPTGTQPPSPAPVTTGQFSASGT